MATVKEARRYLLEQGFNWENHRLLLSFFRNLEQGQLVVYPGILDSFSHPIEPIDLELDMAFCGHVVNHVGAEDQQLLIPNFVCFEHLPFRLSCLSDFLDEYLCFCYRAFDGEGYAVTPDFIPTKNTSIGFLVCSDHEGQIGLPIFSRGMDPMKGLTLIRYLLDMVLVYPMAVMPTIPIAPKRLEPDPTVQPPSWPPVAKALPPSAAPTTPAKPDPPPSPSPPPERSS